MKAYIVFADYGYDPERLVDVYAEEAAASRRIEALIAAKNDRPNADAYDFRSREGVAQYHSAMEQWRKKHPNSDYENASDFYILEVNIL